MIYSTLLVYISPPPFLLLFYSSPPFGLYIFNYSSPSGSGTPLLLPHMATTTTTTTTLNGSFNTKHSLLMYFPLWIIFSTTSIYLPSPLPLIMTTHLMQ